MDEKELAALFPQIVDASGTLMARSDVLGLVSQLAQVAHLAKLNQTLELQNFEGKMDSRSLSITDDYTIIDLSNEWPWTPYVGMYIANYGPNTVKVAINEPDISLSVRADEDRKISYLGAKQRIERIYLTCDSGETATVTLEAQF